MAHERSELWWLALVTFERDTVIRSEYLPDHCQGACGWMACLALDAKTAMERIDCALREVGLRALEIADVSPIESFHDLQEWNSHLAANIEALEPGKSVV